MKFFDNLSQVHTNYYESFVGGRLHGNSDDCSCYMPIIWISIFNIHFLRRVGKGGGRKDKWVWNTGSHMM